MTDSKASDHNDVEMRRQSTQSLHLNEEFKENNAVEKINYFVNLSFF